MHMHGLMKTSAWLRRHPDTSCALVRTNKVLTIAGYVAYPLLLILAALFRPDLLLRLVVVPAFGFVLVSVFRYLLNAKRPYELYPIEPAIKKETKGKSFPSRHTFCMFMIAASWILLNIYVGILLMVAGVLMGCIRVVCGVHFPRDVIAGAFAALVIAYFGYGIIPW